MSHLPAEAKRVRRHPKQAKSALQLLGPGLITGASDDDPSGIATYSQVGAQFGYGMLWTMLFSYPLMAGIQEISALIGRVTGHGIAGNMRRHYSKWLMYGVVALVVAANTVNLGADIGAMGAAMTLLVGGSSLLYASIMAVIALVLQVFMPYHLYVKILKWLTLALFAYVATALVAHVDWPAALRALIIPAIHMDAGYITALVAVLGTTISPYLFFWQASEEAEEEELNPDEKPLLVAPRQAAYQIKRIEIDTYVGMAVSNLVALFIILTVAVTLHKQGITNIQTSAEAARALRPIAGNFAFALFTIGMIGTGMLAIPVLAGSAAYAVGEALRWPVGLERQPLQAKGFYAVLSFAILIGLALNFFHTSPIKALFWSAVINGVAAGPIMVTMMLMSSNSRIMGQFCLSRRLRITGWLATIVMILAAIAMFATWGK